MKAASAVAAVVALALLPLSVGVAVRERSDRRAEVTATLGTIASDEAGHVDAYFARARTVALLTAHNPAFADFYSAPGTRAEKLRRGGPLAGRVRSALAYVRQLYGGDVRAVEFLDAGSPGASPVGEVDQSKPYLSAATHDWVISTSAPIAPVAGRSPGVVRFELAVEAFRRAAATLSHGRVVRVVDGRSGNVVFDSRYVQRVGAPLGRNGDGRFDDAIRIVGGIGSTTIDGRPAAYRAVAPTAGNANRWFVVVNASDPLPAFPSGLGAGPTSMFMTSLILLFFSLLGFRTSRNELLTAALTDSLTGLGNRRSFVADLDRRIASTDAKSPIVLVLFDLDGFKSYNDAFGHPAGDALLSRLARRLAAVMPQGAIAYRMGGDEFCVLADAVGGAAEAVTASGAAALSEKGEGFVVTASHGTVVVPLEAHTASEALRLADQRMYVRKQGGRPTADRQSADVLVRALAERAPSLGSHVDEVAALAEAVSAKLGLGTAERRAVERAARLHDVGKMAVPDAILDKPGALDDEEWEFMRRHTLVGERILAAAPSLAPVADLVRASHERVDGLGYPDGLKGEEIPLGARIVAVCDAYDAMISERAYRLPRAPEEAIAELRSAAGTQFDPRVVEAFCAVVQERMARRAA